MKMKREIAELEQMFPLVEWPKPEPTLDGTFYAFDREMRKIVRENLDDDVNEVECFTHHTGRPLCVVSFEMSVYCTMNEKYLKVAYKEVIDPAQPLVPQIERLQDQKRRIRESLLNPLTLAP